MSTIDPDDPSTWPDGLAEKVEAFAREAEAHMKDAPMIGQSLTEKDRAAMLRRVLDEMRRAGVPAVRAYFDGDCIVVEHARPRGHG